MEIRHERFRADVDALARRLRRPRLARVAGVGARRQSLQPQRS
jgi:hypothetical protein